MLKEVHLIMLFDTSGVECRNREWGKFGVYICDKLFYQTVIVLTLQVHFVTDVNLSL